MKKVFTKNFGMTKFKDAKHSLTFRTFLLILAGGIMMTACKKEEKMNVYQQNLHFKNYEIQSNTPPPQDTLPFYYLAEANVLIDGVICNKYVSSIDPSLIVYIPVSGDFAYRKYKWNAYIDINTFELKCEGTEQKECFKRLDGSICVKKNAQMIY